MPLRRLFEAATTRARRLPASARYGAAFGLAGAAYAARCAVVYAFGTVGFPFLLALPAVLLASLYGAGPGLVATAISTLIAATVLPPPESLAVALPEHWLALGVFASFGGLLALTIDSLAHALELNRAQAEELRRSERARAVILQEFRHRMRNDLQSLVSLLRLRARGTKSIEGKAALIEAGNHAMGLARVHRRLETVQLEEDGAIGSRPFVLELAEELERAHTAEGLRPVSLVAAAEEHRIPTEAAVHLGIILNELVTNAFKYAFPEEASGQISISFRREGESFVLTVADNGKGIPPALEAAPGLGTRLLRALAATLKGQFRRGPGPDGTGTVAEVRFPADRPRIPVIVPGECPSRPVLRSVA